MFIFDSLFFRCALSAITAFLITLLVSPGFIRRLQAYHTNQIVRHYLPQNHSGKTSTPTLGGFLILISIAISVLLWGNWHNRYLWIVLGVTLGCGGIGLVDDWLKLTQQNTRGLPGLWKIVGLSLFSTLGLSMVYAWSTGAADTQLSLVLFKPITIQLGVLFIVWGTFVVVGSSNAVNLTDGLDGLAALPIALVALGLGILAYVTGQPALAKHFAVPIIPGVDELSVFCATITGSALGFLWFNAHPADIFMGDVGSLGLGAGLGMVAMVTRHEFRLLIMGGIFVLETLSVITQVLYFKTSGKRFFKMAPIHHHFELIGWPESKIVVRFWLITILLVMLGLATLAC